MFWGRPEIACLVCSSVTPAQTKQTAVCLKRTKKLLRESGLTFGPEPQQRDFFCTQTAIIHIASPEICDREFFFQDPWRERNITEVNKNSS